MAIAIESLKYLQKSDNLKIYAYVILENHLHLVIQSDDLPKTVQKFKRHTSKHILALLTDSQFQLWQEGYQPKLIQNDATMISKIEYIHHSPIKRGYVEEDWHWRYSSARDYKGLEGLIEVEKFF